MSPGVYGQTVDMWDGNPGGAQGCNQCHAPLAEQQKKSMRGRGPLAAWGKNPAHLQKLEMAGLACAACHVRNWRVHGPPKKDPKPGDAKAGAGGVSDATSGGDPTSGGVTTTGEHGGVLRTPFLERAESCMGCHQHTGGGPNGKAIQNTYNGWRDSIWAKEGVQCQKCHKGTSKNRLTSPDFVLSQHFSHNSYPFSILSSAIGTPKSLPMAGAAPIFNRLLMAPSGSTPPKDFSYPTLAGEKRTLGEFRGRVVLLSFFATWCPLCNEEMPKLVRVHEKYKARGLTVLAVSVDRSPASFVKLWAEKKKLNYPVLHDQKFQSRLRYNVRNVPTIYVLDRNLQLAAWSVGRVNWEGKKAARLIENLLAKPAAEGDSAK